MTKSSPRITANGTLKWYCGDNFNMELILELQKDNEPFTLQPNDKIIVSFYKWCYCQKQEVYSFTFTQPEVKVNTNADNNEENIITLSFTPEVSAKFDVGKYTYCVTYIDGETEYASTIAADKNAEVESCH